MDEQGLEGCFLFPTLGVGMEEALVARPRGRRTPRSARSTAGSTTTGASTTRTASSRAPYITLLDPDRAVAELEWALDQRRPRRRDAGRAGHGARAAAARPATRCTTRSGRASPRPASPSRTTRATRATAATSTTGASRRVRGVPPHAAHGVLTGDRADLRHDRRADLPRRVRPLPEPARRHDRERLRVGAAAAARS